MPNPSIDADKVSQCIEALCNGGCNVVRATIESIERDLDLPQLKDLSVSEREAVLNELKAVMAVYDRK